MLLLHFTTIRFRKSWLQMWLMDCRDTDHQRRSQATAFSGASTNSKGISVCLPTLFAAASPLPAYFPSLSFSVFKLAYPLSWSNASSRGATIPYSRGAEAICVRKLDTTIPTKEHSAVVTDAADQLSAHACSMRGDLATGQRHTMIKPKPNVGLAIKVLL